MLLMRTVLDSKNGYVLHAPLNDAGLPPEYVSKYAASSGFSGADTSRMRSPLV